LAGGHGVDLLRGLGGNDTLTGGGGADRFVFDTALGATNVDTIMDFETGVDALVLDDVIFTALGIAGVTDSMLAEGAQALDAQTRLIYNSTMGALFYDSDGAGGQAQVQFAQFGTTAFPILDGSSFMVV
jgi:Ca2+-binding RTX toxin-like protein